MRYMNAELEIVKFQAEDIIATSFVGELYKEGE